jgi:hypothetical protein
MQRRRGRRPNSPHTLMGSDPASRSAAGVWIRQAAGTALTTVGGWPCGEMFATTWAGYYWVKVAVFLKGRQFVFGTESLTSERRRNDNSRKMAKCMKREAVVKPSRPEIYIHCLKSRFLPAGGSAAESGRAPAITTKQATPRAVCCRIRDVFLSRPGCHSRCLANMGITDSAGNDSHAIVKPFKPS